MLTHELPTVEALGPLNEYEQRHAPERLYLAGDPDLLRRGPKVSIVGSRKASPNALRYTRDFAATLASAGVVIVSGLAKGVDTAAHEAAMEAGGRTLAVLGTPLDRAYPEENKPLQERIARDHLVVSQFPPGSPVTQKSFPLRNRLMALICDATVIVEAGTSSGTQHQGWEALRLNRPLFLAPLLFRGAVPEWVEKLQEYGAARLESVEDVLSSVPPEPPRNVAAAF